MKTWMNFATKLALLLFVGTLLFNTTQAQTKKQKRLQALTSLIQSKNFQFEATYMRPMTGTGRTLEQGYGLRIAADSVTSQLPFVGNAMTVARDDSRELEFTTRKFDYALLTGDTGGWQITITPKDHNGTVEMVLTIDDEGDATLVVKSSTHDPMTYSGSVEARGRW